MLTKAVEEQASEDIVLSLDAFVRSIGVRRSTPFAMFLGAGASTTSGVPSAQMCVWEWKRQIFLTNNPGVEDQFTELSLEGVRRKIQKWLDRQGSYPPEGSPEEYGFYIKQCFPISDDRRAFFQQKVLEARPHIGYRLLCHLAEADLVRSVWSTNFDGLIARAAANFKLAPVEVGIDTPGRISRSPSAGELLCVSLHGDYRYDQLKNTPEELQTQETALQKALVQYLKGTPLIVCGYSGRDQSVMQTLRAAYSERGSAALYWCGFTDSEVPAHVASLIQHARVHGRQAYYVPALGFDDLLTRVALHCLQDEKRKAAAKCLEEFVEQEHLPRAPFDLPNFNANTLIKSNAFAIECPSEVLQFDLKNWPPRGGVWSTIRGTIGQRPIVAAPFKGKILALGTVDDIKEAFGENIKGPIERTPVSPTDLRYEDGAVVSLMREALVRSMAEATGVRSDKRHELWQVSVQKKVMQRGIDCEVFPSVQLFFRRIGGAQYVVLKPSLKVLNKSGADVPVEVANPIKLGILGYQHNKPFNQAVNTWRELLLPKGKEAVFEFPRDCGSTFKFKIHRSPVFGKIGLPQGGASINTHGKLQPLLKQSGLQLPEPQLVFSNKAGTGTVKSAHPIRGIVENRPYD